MSLFDAVASEYLIRFRRHLAAGHQDPEAHRLAALETGVRCQAAVVEMEKAGAALEEPTILATLAARGWALAPSGIRLPSEAEDLVFRPKPAHCHCGSGAFWEHQDGTWWCATCHHTEGLQWWCPKCRGVCQRSEPTWNEEGNLEWWKLDRCVVCGTRARTLAVRWRGV